MSLFRECNKPDEQFYKACLNGKTATVRKLLDIQDERLSRSATDPIYGYAHVPLYLACFGGHQETVSLLSERGADFQRAMCEARKRADHRRREWRSRRADSPVPRARR